MPASRAVPRGMCGVVVSARYGHMKPSGGQDESGVEVP